MSATRRSQPYRKGPRAPGQALSAMLKGRSHSGGNPMDVKRELSVLSRSKGGPKRPARPVRPPRPDRLAQVASVGPHDSQYAKRNAPKYYRPPGGFWWEGIPRASRKRRLPQRPLLPSQRSRWA